MANLHHIGNPAAEAEAEVLLQVDSLLAELLTAALQLPVELARETALQCVQLKAEVTAPDRDPARVRAVLGRLTAAVPAAGPLLEIVQEIAGLVARLR